MLAKHGEKISAQDDKRYLFNCCNYENPHSPHTHYQFKNWIYHKN